MSTILDALRRLEQDKQVGKEGNNPLQAVFTAETPYRERWDGKRLVLLGFGFLVLLIAAVTVTYWVAGRTTATLVTPDPEGEVSARIAASADLASESISNLHQVPGPLPRKGQAGDTTGDSRLSPLSGGEAASVHSPLVSHVPPEQGGPIGSERASPPSKRTRESVQDRFLVEDIPAKGPEVFERLASPASAVSSAPVQRNVPGIKISAIVWSSEPQSRFAVVNLKTVHEGESVGDFRVAEIQEDGLVFQEGSETFKVLLGRR